MSEINSPNSMAHTHTHTHTHTYIYINREGSITSHAIRDCHLTKMLGLAGVRHYQGTGKLALASYGNILRRDLRHGEECIVKKGKNLIRKIEI